jgi:hypothetical protein
MAASVDEQQSAGFLGQCGRKANVRYLAGDGEKSKHLPHPAGRCDLPELGRRD